MSRLPLEIIVVLLLPPLLMSVIAKTKAAFAGRVGPPWLQPYRELLKLLRKGSVYSGTTTWVFRLGPVISLAALLTATTLVPVLSRRAWISFSGDLVLLAYLLALGRMFTVLAALDTGSSFEGMGAAREVSFGTMSEPALFLCLAALAIATRSLRLGDMLGAELAAAWQSAGPAMILVVGALLVVLVTECCRIPVDDPATHLELTMIHEVMVLDHGGPDFAFISYGAALKFMLLGSLLLHAAFPLPAGPAWQVASIYAAVLVALAIVVGVIESTMARLRLNRVPLLLAGATVLAGLAVLLVLTPEGRMNLHTAIDGVLVMVLLLDLAILAAGRLATCIRIFALQCLVIAALPVAAELVHGLLPGPHGLILLGGTVLLKVLLIPWVLMRTIRAGDIHREVEPLIGFTGSVVVGAMMMAGSFAVATRLRVPAQPLSDLLVPAALSTVMIGLLVLVSRTKAITQVLGYLVLENGIFLFGLTLVRQMPVLVELGILLDVFVGVFVMAIVVYHIRREFDHVDTDVMVEELRGREAEQ